MKNLKTFTRWISLSEATLNDSKADIIYTLSRSGRDKIKSVANITGDIVFEPSEILPSDNDSVIHIRPSSFRDVKFSEIKEIYKIEDPKQELFIYETTSQLYPYAVALKGTKTTMIKQKFREGASARGDYFRETAFVITMAIRLWKKLRVKIEISSNRGYIPMIFEDDGQAYPNPQRAEFRNQYWQFMDKPQVGEAMIKQCDSLIDRLGESARRIKMIQKNSVDLSINKFFKIALDKEREKLKAKSSNYHFLPDRLAISKWNPSDMWIAFDKFKWMVSDRIENVEPRFKRLKIFGLEDLNGFLANSIIHKDGIIGVSLKQQIIDPGKIYSINLEKKPRFVHSYKSYQAKLTSKSVKLIFGFSFDDLGNLIDDSSRKKNTPVGEGEIDVRTFSTDIQSPISMEVKGSKTSGHMSGKAGSYIKYIMPPNDYAILNYIQREKDTSNIENYVKNNYEFTKPDLQTLFYTDTKSPKTNSSNSRMQAVFFADWIESLNDEDLKDEIISDIIRFAKSESNWSAPHILVK